MSKRHHATRRRTYGRRQHEMHQRIDLAQVAMSWDGPGLELPSAPGPDLRPALRPGAGVQEAGARWPHLRDRD
jgi:hypothetical protein